LARRFIDVLRVLAKDLIEKGYNADDAFKKINIIDIDMDFLTVKEELTMMEMARFIDEAELDTIKALLTYILMKDTDLEAEEIYAFVFGHGRQIIWN